MFLVPVPFLGMVSANVTYQTNVSNTNGASSYTWNNVALGTATADRYIIIGYGQNRAGGSMRTISSVTIAGVTATTRVTINASSVSTALAIAAVPTGTLGNLVITWSGATGECFAGIWSATGISNPVPTATYTDITDPGAATMVISGGGIGVGYVASDGGGSTGGPVDWTGLIEDFESEAAGTNVTQTGASKDGGSAGLSVTVNPVPSVSDLACVFASWR